MTSQGPYGYGMNPLFSHGQSILQMPHRMHFSLLGHLPRNTLNQPAEVTPSFGATITNNYTNDSIQELASREFTGINF
ncbi:hypothetical protein MRB53_005800 [Persea americana]|uniref:Uncharacterized protein n=1 Tax=Persea americana TaxID=3435 RepID=A0ACC2ME31_PERAE|nr:hypothetical protein MRB53_005800 [Persea americana]